MRKTNKKILVTGGAGYIGQNLINFFLKNRELIGEYNIAEISPIYLTKK